jgi:diguanylate cyclase (GGDEF)-like protein
VHPDHTSTPDAPAQVAERDERESTGRIAAVVWAGIAFFGALATLKPMRFTESNPTAMRLVVLSAVTIAAVTFLLPWRQVPKNLVSMMLVLMSVHISALAYASGAVHSDLVMLGTFVVALGACFLPVRTSLAQVILIAALLGAGLVLLDKDSADIAALRTTLLLAMLVVLLGLVLILRAVIAEREAQLRRGAVFQSGLLDKRHATRLLDRELSRASRHARPLALVMLDVSGQLVDGADPDHTGRLVTLVARSILGRIRVEDSAAHMEGLRFAIVAPETDGTGAAAVAEAVKEVVRRRLVTLGYESESFDIAIGWADFPHQAQSRADLIGAASGDLEAAVLRKDSTSPRRGRDAPAAGRRPAAAGPG